MPRNSPKRATKTQQPRLRVLLRLLRRKSWLRSSRRRETQRRLQSLRLRLKLIKRRPRRKLPPKKVR